MRMPDKPSTPKELFCCSHLSVDDAPDIKDFTVRDKNGKGLEQYIRKRAFEEEELGLMKTYIVRERESYDIVGYFSLKAGLISYGERDDDGEITFDTIPGVEIANFAINNSYIQKHPKSKGVGFVIFNKFIRPAIEEAANHIGVTIIYIFALNYPRLLELYHEQYGFVRLDQESENRLHSRIKPAYDQGCIFMYQMLRKTS